MLETAAIVQTIELGKEVLSMDEVVWLFSVVFEQVCGLKELTSLWVLRIVF